MNTHSLSDRETLRAALAKLFQEKSPVLVEVRFPCMGTSADWYLCEEPDELDPILERLSPGTEVRLSSVWDLHDPTGGTRLTR